MSGPVGVGKTTVAAEASTLLSEAGIPHGVFDLPALGGAFPPPSDDPWNEQIAHRNLAAVWANVREAGAERLILSRVVEHRAVLARIVEAVPGAEIALVGLRAPTSLLYERIRAREAGRNPQWYLDAAADLAEKLGRDPVEDFVVENGGRPARETAREALRLIGWLT